MLNDQHFSERMAKRKIRTQIISLFGFCQQPDEAKRRKEEEKLLGIFFHIICLFLFGEQTITYQHLTPRCDHKIAAKRTKCNLDSDSNYNKENESTKTYRSLSSFGFFEKRNESNASRPQRCDDVEG